MREISLRPFFLVYYYSRWVEKCRYRLILSLYSCVSIAILFVLSRQRKELRERELLLLDTTTAVLLRCCTAWMLDLLSCIVHAKPPALYTLIREG